MEKPMKFNVKKLWKNEYPYVYETKTMYFKNTDTAGQYAYNTYNKQGFEIFEERTKRDGRKVFTVKDQSHRIRLQIKQLPHDIN